MNTDFSQVKYDEQLSLKVAKLCEKFSCFNPPKPDVYASKPTGFRMRAEFKIWHDGAVSNYAMYRKGEYKKPYTIQSFPQGHTQINHLMPQLLQHIIKIEILRKKLFQIEFLTTLSGEMLVTLIYHKKLGDEWTIAAKDLKKTFNIHMLGRSRGQKIILDQDFVTETLSISGVLYHYQQIESSFTQPNARICTEMLNWAVTHSKNNGGDLVELYCGNGNFTLPLAKNFNQVLATELAKSSVRSANYNIALNHIDNIKVIRMSSEDFSLALDKVRPFRRLADINLDDYNFSTIFVDPPRSGMDPHTTEITQRFDHIIYISCNPNTLFENLKTMTKTHNITRFAIFDQFPFTEHIECGVTLRIKK